MGIWNIYQAKAHFSQLINQVLKGEEVVIAKSGVPVVKLVQYEKKTISRKGGNLKEL
jgi:prevent-host-death family protein